LEYGHSYCGNVVHNFIIVCIDFECDPEDFGASHFGIGIWIKFLDKNVNDIDVLGCNKDPSGVVVARFSMFPKKNNLEMKSIKLVEEVYHSPGLQRGRTTHEGRFFVCGVRQSSMSSGSMTQVSSPRHHHYFDETKTNTSLVNFCQPILRDLSVQALEVRDSSG